MQYSICFEDTAEEFIHIAYGHLPRMGEHIIVRRNGDSAPTVHNVVSVDHHMTQVGAGDEFIPEGPIVSVVRFNG